MNLSVQLWKHSMDFGEIQYWNLMGKLAVLCSYLSGTFHIMQINFISFHVNWKGRTQAAWWSHKPIFFYEE
jgi:hypothetical protein